MTTTNAPVAETSVAEVDELDVLDFQQILANPSFSYEESFRFLRGRGLLNQAMSKLARGLESSGIGYVVIGAVALNLHGYRRVTTDIDLLMTPESLERFASLADESGYHPAFSGARKKFRAVKGNVPVNIITTGEYPGDGKPKSVAFPNPADVSVEINGVWTVSLEKLIDLKLASGMSGAARLKDLSDTQELIRALDLGTEIANQLDASVRSLYLKLHAELVAGRLQTLAPDYEQATV